MRQLWSSCRNHVDGGALCGQHIERVETSLSRFEQNGIPVKGVILTPSSAAPARIRIMAITNTNKVGCEITRSAVGCDADASYPPTFTPHPATEPVNQLINRQKSRYSGRTTYERQSADFNLYATWNRQQLAIRAIKSVLRQDTTTGR